MTFDEQINEAIRDFKMRLDERDSRNASHAGTMQAGYERRGAGFASFLPPRLEKEADLVPFRKGATAGCCLYPWPDPDGTPLYPATDLPATVVITGASPLGGLQDGTYTHTAGTYIFLDGSGNYRITFGMGGWIGEQLEAGLWTFADTDLEPCLIGEWDWNGVGGLAFPVADEFAGTYLANGVITLTRESPCIWNGPDPDEGESRWFMKYVSDPSIPPSGKPNWFLSDNGAVNYWKTDPQSDPTGTYNEDGGPDIVIVT